MSLAFIVYVVTTLLPAIASLFVMVACIGCLVSLYYAIIRIVGIIEYDDDEMREKYLGKTKFLASGTVLCTALFLGNLIPDKEDSYAILAAYGVEEIISNEKVKDVAGKSLEVLEKAMSEYLDEDKDRKE